MSRLTINPRLRVLFDEDGNEVPAVALGRTSAEAMEAFRALKTGALEQVGQDPARTSPVAVKTYKQPVKRADDAVVPFTISLGIAHVAPKGTAAADAPEVI